MTTPAWRELESMIRSTRFSGDAPVDLPEPVGRYFEAALGAQMPGALDMLGDGDRDALSLLPDEPARAAEAFCAGSEVMTAVIDDEESFMAGVDALFGATDADVLGDPRLRHHLFAMLSEGMRQGFTGVGWDNVAWVGPWDVDLSLIHCPVHLWYGERDSMMPVEHGRWLADNVPDADLVVYGGEGHLGPMRHWREMLTAVRAENERTRPVRRDEPIPGPT